MNETPELDGYLRRLRRAARGLPRSRRRELIAQIQSHVAEACEAGVPAEDALRDLGEPEAIAAAAQGPARTGLGGRDAAAIVLLLCGGFIAGIGWLAGVVLLWTSPRWRWTDKLLGTLIWPGGYAGLLAGLLFGLTTPGQTTVCASSAGGHQTCTSTGFALPPWLGIASVVLIVLAPAAVAIRLAVARQEEPEAETPVTVRAAWG